MGMYRKRPVVIEARQLGNGPINDIDLASWCGGNLGLNPQAQGGAHPYIDIVTLEGTMRADLGDWIIKGVNGEFYPCKPDIFDKTYEPVE